MRRRSNQIAAIFVGVLIVATIARPDWFSSSDAEVEAAGESGQAFGEKYAWVVVTVIIVLVVFAVVPAIRRKRDRHQ